MSVTDAMKIAQDYLEGVQSKDRAAVDRSLADGVRHVFPMGSGGWRGLAAVYEGREEVLHYTYSLFDLFETIEWRNQDWTVSADGSRVFMQANSDCVLAESGARYRNTYVMRFDISDGKISQIL